MTFEDRRSPAAKEEAARDYAEWTKSLAEAEKECDRWRALCWASGVPWQVIETCPFKALDNSHGFEGAILVTDGKSVALASVSKRFGRPVRMTGEIKRVMTDHGMQFEGGTIEEIDAPDWWFEWELTDQFGSENYAGGEPIGKDEVDFVPTHWVPLPRGK